MAILAAGLGAVLISLSQFSGGWLLGTVGLVALGVLVGARLAGGSTQEAASTDDVLVHH